MSEKEYDCKCSTLLFATLVARRDAEVVKAPTQSGCGTCTYVPPVWRGVGINEGDLALTGKGERFIKHGRDSVVTMH